MSVPIVMKAALVNFTVEVSMGMTLMAAKAVEVSLAGSFEVTNR